MLKYSFNMQEDSILVENAVQGVLSKGLRTADISDGADKVVSTQDMGKAVIEELKNLSGN
jgi:3-isopropylmalate dehydrogenase